MTYIYHPTVFVVQESGRNLAQLSWMPLAQGLSQTTIKVLAKAVISVEGSTEQSTSKFIHVVVGWIQFLGGCWTEV